MQDTEAVIIKGVREGLLFILADDVPFPAILSELSERVNSRPSFFRGAGIILNSGRRVIDRPEFDVLYKMLARNEMKVLTFVSLSAQSRMVAEGYGVASRPPTFASGDAGVSLGLRGRGSSALAEAAQEGGMSETGAGLFLRCNLRQGQTVRYPGDVCMLGDVEAGAEVIADGDVVIWGTLYGLVHAGAAGDDEAVVCALQMSPAQLGIAGVVTRFPSHDGSDDRPPSPELARLEEGRIVIERWVSSNP